MLSGRGLCDELITRPEGSYRLCCVVVRDLETSRMGAPYIYDISSLRVNAVINNNYERLQDLILFLRIPIGTRKDLFEIYRHFGHTTSKRFASPGMCDLG